MNFIGCNWPNRWVEEGLRFLSLSTCSIRVVLIYNLRRVVKFEQPGEIFEEEALDHDFLEKSSKLHFLSPNNKLGT